MVSLFFKILKHAEVVVKILNACCLSLVVFSFLFFFISSVF